MKNFIIKDINGNEINEGQKFKFKYMQELYVHIELIGSFRWNDEELRYTIDIWENCDYDCLDYVGNGMMYNFKLL